MTIPEHLKRPNMTPERTKQIEAWVKSKREIMRKAPTYGTTQEATKAAVETYKKDEYSRPTVWKEPKDIGNKYAVVMYEDRENAYISGYTEVVDRQTIFDKANGNHIDEIEEA